LSALMDDPREQVYGPLDQGQGSVECWWLNVALRDDPHELADYPPDPGLLIAVIYVVWVDLQWFLPMM